MKITLDTKEHIYRSDKGDTYKSVSHLIDQFVPFFDFEQKSYDYSVKYGIPVEDVRQSWRDKNRLSTDFGQKIHSTIEKMIKENAFTHEEKTFDDIAKKIEKYIQTANKIHSEKIIYNSNYKIAGTSDVILERDNDFDIIDFKTNKKIKFENPFEDKFLLFPLNEIPNSEYFKYALQLSLYAYMYELLSNKRAYRLIIFWLKRKKPENYNTIDGTWVKLSLPYLKEEAKTILEYGSQK